MSAGPEYPVATLPLALLPGTPHHTDPLPMLSSTRLYAEMGAQVVMAVSSTRLLHSLVSTEAGNGEPGRPAGGVTHGEPCMSWAGDSAVSSQDALPRRAASCWTNSG